MKGVWNKKLNVNLNNKKIKEEKINDEIIRKYLGGNGLGIKLLHEETEGKPEPFSEDNPLIFVPGLLNGSGIPMSEKCGYYSKSPLTGIMAEGISGSGLGEQVKKSGYDAISIKGKNENLSYLLIKQEEVEIVKAPELEGLRTKKTEEILTSRHGGKAMVIGPAGENLVRFSLINGDGRQVGRTGLGSVMGSKNLKAIVANGTKEIKPSNPKKVDELQQKYLNEFIKEDGKGKESFDGYSNYGTIKFTRSASELGILPTRYWETGEFEEADKLTSYDWENQISKNKGCNKCPCRCGQVYKDIVDVEFETSYSLGSNLEIGDIRKVAKANYLCDELGIDTIGAGNVIGLLIKLSEEGEVDVDLQFGDIDSVRKSIRKIAYRDGIGDIAAEGVKRLGDHYDRSELAVHVKGLTPPAYDPRAIKGMGLAFYTSTRGACHLRSDCDGIELGEGETPNDKGEWITEKGDRFSYENKEYIPPRENYMSLHDSLGTCKLTGRDVYSLKAMKKIINAYLGTDLTIKQVYKTGERIYNMERLFNLWQKPEIKNQVHVPQQFETPSPAKGAKNETFTEEKIKEMLNNYYQERGWNENGVPTKQKLKELDIQKRDLIKT